MVGLIEVIESPMDEEEVECQLISIAQIKIHSRGDKVFSIVLLINSFIKNLDRILL